MIKRKPTHPGEILKEDVLPALKWNASKTAKMLDVSRQYMSDILNAKKPLTPLLCLKLAKLLGNEPEFWMNLQGKHTLWELAQDSQNQRVLAHIPSFKDMDAHTAGQ